MAAQTLPEYLDTILCDDIRREVNNKLSLIGVYGNKIIVPDTPFVFGHLGIIQLWRGGEGEFDVGFVLSDPEGKEMRRFPPLPVKLPVKQGETGRVIIRLTGLKVEVAGTYRLITIFNGKTLGEHTFTIEKAPPGYEFQ